MEFQSDQNRFKNLLDTEELTHIEFSEHFGSERDSDKLKLHGGNANLNEVEQDFFAIFNNAKEYSKRLENIAEAQNTDSSRRLLSATPEMKGGDDFDSLDRMLGSKTSDYKMAGGADLDSLDRLLMSESNKMTGGAYSESSDRFYTSTGMNGGGDDSCGRTTDELSYSMVDNSDYDFAARSYDQYGGKGEKIKKIIEVAQFLKPKSAFKNFKWTEVVSVAGIIWKDAEEKTKITDPEDKKLMSKAKELAENPEKYIKEYKERPPKEKKPKKKKAPKCPPPPKCPPAASFRGGYY